MNPYFVSFFFNDTATTEIYTLSLHDALPISTTLNLTIDAQNLRHLRLEIGIATFQVVAHLVRLDVLLAEDLAHRPLDQVGETFVPRRRSVLVRMACQQPRRPQLVR